MANGNLKFMIVYSDGDPKGDLVSANHYSEQCDEEFIPADMKKLIEEAEESAKYFWGPN